MTLIVVLPYIFGVPVSSLLTVIKYFVFDVRREELEHDETFNIKPAVQQKLAAKNRPSVGHLGDR